MNVVYNASRIIHDRANIQQDGGNFTNWQIEVAIGATDDVDDGQVGDILECLVCNEEKGPEIPFGSAILKDILACERKVECSLILVGKGFDSTNVG